MKKAILFLLLFCITIPAFAQQRSVLKDSTAVPASYDNYSRFGTVLMGRAESGLYRLLLADQSGNLYVTEPIYNVFYTDTSTVTTTKDTIALGATYEKFSVSLDDATKPFWIIFGTDSTKCLRVPAGGIANESVECDTIIVWLESGSSKMNITKRNRERK